MDCAVLPTAPYVEIRCLCIAAWIPTMNMNVAFFGRGEYRCFIGPMRVGTIHSIHGMYYPSAEFKGVVKPGIALRSMEVARAWILITLKEMGKTQ